MSKRISTSPTKVKLMHPDTKEVREFLFGHAQGILDIQAKKKHKPHQSWVLPEDSKYIIKDGKIIFNPDK